MKAKETFSLNLVKANLMDRKLQREIEHTCIARCIEIRHSFEEWLEKQTHVTPLTAQAWLATKLGIVYFVPELTVQEKQEMSHEAFNLLTYKSTWHGDLNDIGPVGYYIPDGDALKPFESIPTKYYIGEKQ